MNQSISVIIPTYNRKQSLIRAMESVLNQTLPAEEIIVIDDGSDDGTEQLITQDYKQVVYLRHENRGVSYTRNRGVDSAKGKWLAFLDSDDQWLPNKLELQMKSLMDNPSYQLCHSEEIWIRNGVRVNAMDKHKKQGGNIFLNCLPLCVISPSSVMMSRDLFQLIGGFDETLPACEDYDLWLRICISHPVLYIEKPLINKYGGHDDQLSRRHWGMDRFRIQALEKIMDSHLLEENMSAGTEISNSALRREYFSATKKILIDKCKILMNGALKRNNTDSAKLYQTIIAKYS